MRRSSTDHEILDALAVAVRMLSLDQIARTWWCEGMTPERHACRHLKGLQRAGLLASHYVQARPLLDLTEPMFHWRPGDTAPNHEAIGHHLLNRWPRPPRRTLVYVATAKARHQYGGASRPVLKRGQATHDLHVAELYVQMRQTDPERAAAWVGEDARGKAGFGLKDPDAVLEFDDGRPQVAIEFGGNYDPRRVLDFHEGCAALDLEYELW